MRLKRLEMVGFKSFADKTRVEFEPGITVIVGPNGCGKSNIADAIRWSLGEMSPKSLRSQHMLDVVFNGTSNRAAQGMSEVALTFDNTSGQIPIDYTDVTISRRLFRSGESEYFINKTQCRLKDIRDLFLDTGIGNEDYYVMAQGKIEFILSAKPEERRELFDEAAGVAKYQARREEALRRLTKVDQDMMRLNDSLAIYKQQIDSLDSAVRKAKTHQKLQEELRQLEIAHYVHQIALTEAQQAQQKNQFDEAQRQWTDLQQKLSEQENRLQTERAQIAAFEQTVLDLQKQVSHTTSEWTKAQSDLKNAQEREAELESSQNRLRDEILQLDQQLDELRMKQDTLSVEIAELDQQSKEQWSAYTVENEKALAHHESARHAQRELESRKSQLMDVARQMSQQRNESVRLQSLSIRHEEALKSKQREVEKLQHRREAIDFQLQEIEQLKLTTQEQLQTLEKQLQDLEEAQTQDKHKLAEIEQAVQSARERIARLEAEKVSMERWLGQDPIAMGTVALRQKGLPGIYGPINTIFHTSEPYQKLLDRALGDRTNYFIADTLNDAQSAIRHLSEERKGWATFIVLDRVHQSDALSPIDPQLGRTLADAVHCDEKFKPIITFLLGKTFYVGATLFEDSILRGGADPVNAGFQATPNDFLRLNQELETLQETLVGLQTTRETLRAAIAQRDSDRHPLQTELRKTQVQAQLHHQNSERLFKDQGLLASEETLVQQEQEECTQAIQQAQQDLETMSETLTQMEARHIELQANVEEQDIALQSQRQEISAFQARVSEYRVAAETAKERLAGKQREQDNTKRELINLDYRREQNTEQQQENEEKRAQFSTLQEERKQLLESLGVSKAQQQQALDQKLAERQTASTTLQELDKEVTQLRESTIQSQRHAQEFEFQLRTMDQEHTRLENGLQETYRMSFVEAQASHGQVEVTLEEIQRIKKRLEGMGAVNLAAPEEHGQLEERYQFLLTQQQDLLKAKEDLHQTITKINATTREHFKETFEKVRQNFKQLYQSLFQGGEADLVLTDASNIQETGIEIMAQPPGKKTQSISLLSGGEKALTAIALLFAFFMVKPSPFCLLDEVDAPLDEANVGRFLQIVKQFAEKTQFIIISHNKRTMEMGDVLYGVTMAELGISNLMSMRLEDKRAVPAETAAV